MVTAWQAINIVIHLGGQVGRKARKHFVGDVPAGFFKDFPYRLGCFLRRSRGRWRLGIASRAMVMAETLVFLQDFKASSNRSG